MNPSFSKNWRYTWENKGILAKRSLRQDRTSRTKIWFVGPQGKTDLPTKFGTPIYFTN